MLAEEVAGIQAYPDGLRAVELLQNYGVRVGVCSNLAFPYGAAIRRCYPTLDDYVLSCELGVIKSGAGIYQRSCELLGLESQEICMIGDSLVCDRDGPTAYGMMGFYLDRMAGKGDFADLLSFVRTLLKMRN